jgi:phosphoribosylformylglycinamidine cyclo-ligase
MMDYKKAGVDTVKAQSYIKTLKDNITATHKKSAYGSVMDNFGGFAGIFNTSPDLKGCHLVASTDGVGTKVELARRFQYFDGLGVDLLAMCINDLYCVGATPLFFLDYIACGKLDESWYFPVMKSIASACEKVSIALLGGETAEHPGVMEDDHFDLAGFIVGAVPPDRVLPALEKIAPGDILYGFSSSGLHSNGFSLVRKALEQIQNENKPLYEKLVNDKSWVKEKLLVPTRIYDFMPQLQKESSIKALAHITGGGIYENLPRVLPENTMAVIDKPGAFPHEIYDLIGGYVKPVDMYHAFNMGIGMIAVADIDQKPAMEKYGAKVVGHLEKRLDKTNSDRRIFIQGIDT